MARPGTYLVIQQSGATGAKGFKGHKGTFGMGILGSTW